MPKGRPPQEDSQGKSYTRSASAKGEQKKGAATDDEDRKIQMECLPWKRWMRMIRTW